MYITSNVIQTYIPRHSGKSLTPSFKSFLVHDRNFVAFRSASLLMIAPCSSCNYGSWSQKKQHAEMVGFSDMVKPGGVLPWENWSLIVVRKLEFSEDTGHLWQFRELSHSKIAGVMAHSMPEIPKQDSRNATFGRTTSSSSDTPESRKQEV